MKLKIKFYVKRGKIEMSLFAMMMIMWSVERPEPIPSVPNKSTWPYKK